MKSIRDIYKIGKGPGFSHTMGPERAAKLYQAEQSDAAGFRAELYGSLSKTGIGHGTGRALCDSLSPSPAEVVFCKEELPGNHPNTMIFYCMADGKSVDPLTAESIGSGDIRIPGRSSEGGLAKHYNRRGGKRG